MRMRLTIPPQTSELRALRRVLEGWSTAHGVAPESLSLIATELVANAIAVSPADGDVELSISLQDEDVTLSVSDSGPAGFEVGRIEKVGAESIRGRGLHIVNSLCNRLTIDREAGRTVVTVHQYRRMLGPLPERGQDGSGDNDRSHRTRARRGGAVPSDVDRSR